MKARRPPPPTHVKPMLATEISNAVMIGDFARKMWLRFTNANKIFFTSRFAIAALNFALLAVFSHEKKLKKLACAAEHVADD